MMRPYIYVITGAGHVAVCLGQGQQAVGRAVNYIIRRHALKGYLTLRQGFPAQHLRAVAGHGPWRTAIRPR